MNVAPTLCGPTPQKVLDTGLRKPKSPKLPRRVQGRAPGKLLFHTAFGNLTILRSFLLSGWPMFGSVTVRAWKSTVPVSVPEKQFRRFRFLFRFLEKEDSSEYGLDWFCVWFGLAQSTVSLSSLMLQRTTPNTVLGQSLYTCDPDCLVQSPFFGPPARENMAEEWILALMRKRGKNGRNNEKIGPKMGQKWQFSHFSANCPLHTHTHDTRIDFPIAQNVCYTRLLQKAMCRN